MILLLTATAVRFFAPPFAKVNPINSGVMRQLKISKSITSRESASLDKYLQEISRVELLSVDDEVRLFTEVKRGNQLAVDQLVKSNLRFVVSVAKQYQGQGLPLSDLINEGNLGLIKAVERFDATRGFKFISFAVWWIRQSIIHALAEDARMIRLPLNKVALRGRIKKTRDLLEQELGRLPSDEEVAENLQLTVKEIQNIMHIEDRYVSLDSPMNEEEEGSLLDILENINAEKTDQALTHMESLKCEIRRSLSLLPERQQEMLCCFFGIGMDHPLSLDEIGKKFDITTERVRQIKDKALHKLRNSSSSHLLRAFRRA